MAYNQLLPADNEFISDGPALIRENQRALKDDRIVDAGKLNGLTQGNASGNIAINNGTLCTNLNADLLDGQHSSYFATATHTHAVVTTSANGLMSNTDKTKLDGITAGAEVNQNTFASIKVGTTTIQADTKTDILELAAGTGITLTVDSTNDKVTISITQDGHNHANATTSSNGFISSTDKAKLDGIEAGAEVNQNTFANVVAGGVTIQADNKTDTLTINAGSGITITGDATNDALNIAVTSNGHSHSNATTSAAGFMSASDKSKLDSVAAGAQTNQNAFSNILVGSTTIIADNATDTLELIAGTNISLSPDATNDRVTINNTYSYNHPTGDGNLHVPATGTTSNNKVLKASSTAGSIAWETQVASEVAFTPITGVSSTNVQAAIAELESAKLEASEVVATATANKILKLNASGVLPASITGNAATVGGFTPSSANSANSVVVQDSSGDINVRLLRTNYATTTGATCAYVLTQNAIGASDNFARPTPLATFRNALNIPDATPKGYQEYTTSGTFTVPADISLVWITACAGGGGSGRASNSANTQYSHYSAGGGQGCLMIPIKVAPGQNIPVTIGDGGLGATVNNSHGAIGGDTLFGSYVTLKGGGNGVSVYTPNNWLPLTSSDGEGAIHFSGFTTASQGGLNGGGWDVGSVTVYEGIQYYLIINNGNSIYSSPYPFINGRGGNLSNSLGFNKAGGLSGIAHLPGLSSYGKGANTTSGYGVNGLAGNSGYLMVCW